jgi:hypothetical protein
VIGLDDGNGLSDRLEMTAAVVFDVGVGRGLIEVPTPEGFPLGHAAMLPPSAAH